MIIHIYSAVRFIQYGDKVLSSYHGKSHPLPITHAAVSLTVVGGGFVLLVTILVIRILKSKKHDAQLQSLIKQSDAEAATSSMRKTNTHKYWPAMLSAAMISVNITYLGCYFFLTCFWPLFMIHC